MGQIFSFLWTRKNKKAFSLTGLCPPDPPQPLYLRWGLRPQTTVTYIWYSEEGPGRAGVPPSPLIAVPNVTAHPSTASVPITVSLCDGPLLCGFNVAIKGLSSRRRVLRSDVVHLFVCSSAVPTTTFRFTFRMRLIRSTFPRDS